MTITAIRPVEQTALLAAIFLAPDDDTPRLVYADCLEENGDVARAELIRVQCELAHLLVDGKCPRCKDYGGPCNTCEFTPIEHLRRRESALLAQHEAEWRCPAPCPKCEKWKRRELSDWIIEAERRNCPTCHGLGRIGVLGECDRFQPGASRDGWWRIPVTWSRGFPVISCPVAWWCAAWWECPKCEYRLKHDGNQTSAWCFKCDVMCKQEHDYPNARRAWTEMGYCEVRLSDVEPADRLEVNGEMYWFWNDRNALGHWQDNSHIPDVLFDLLPGAEPHTIGLPFPTVEAAHAALARAAARLARGLAMGKA